MTLKQLCKIINNKTTAGNICNYLPKFWGRNRTYGTEVTLRTYKQNLFHIRHQLTTQYDLNRNKYERVKMMGIDTYGRQIE